MGELGFLPGGRDNHRRACQQHVVDLRKQLEDCKSEDRVRIESEIEETRKKLRDADDREILW